MCVCKIWLKKVPLVIEILAKQHRGHFLDTLYSQFSDSDTMNDI